MAQDQVGCSCTPQFHPGMDRSSRGGSLSWMAGGSGKNLPKSSEQEKCKFSAKQDPLLLRTIFGFFFFPRIIRSQKIENKVTS